MYGGFRKLGTPSHQCYLIGCSINYKPSSYSATPPFMETHIYLYILNPNVGPKCLWSILKCVIQLYAMYPSNSMNMYDTYVCTCI